MNANMTANKSWLICCSFGVLFLQNNNLFVLQFRDPSSKLAKINPNSPTA